MLLLMQPSHQQYQLLIQQPVTHACRLEQPFHVDRGIAHEAACLQAQPKTIERGKDGK